MTKDNDSVVRRIGHLLSLVFVVGPDRPRPRVADDSTRWSKPWEVDFWERVLPWWLRVTLVVVAWMVGHELGRTGLGDELAAALQYGAMVGVSIAASNWWPLLVVNALVALVWLLFTLRYSGPETTWGKATTWVVIVDRQLAHIELHAVWWTVALALHQDLQWQLPLWAAVLLLEPAINGIGTGSHRLLHRLKLTETAVNKEDGTLYWSRRPFVYLATFVGQLVILFFAPLQWRRMLPVMLAVLLPDLVRFLGHLLHNRVDWTKPKAPMQAVTATPSASPAAEAMAASEIPAPAVLSAPASKSPLEIRVQQIEAAGGIDGWLSKALLGAILLFAYLLTLEARSAGAQSGADEGMAAALPQEICNPNAPEPAAEVSVLLLADNHVHELGGKRFAGQREFADALVPVARRPVELDILSTAALAQFSRVFQQLADNSGDGKSERLYWAHLGDFADLGCRGELDRATRALKTWLPESRFIGLTPGNHDKTFAGNFAWSPYWESACPSGRLEKAVSDRSLRAAWGEAVQRNGGQMEPVEVPMSAWFGDLTDRGGALVGLMPLGLVTDRGRQHGLVALFIDTADEIEPDLGIAGLLGTLSKAQVDKLLAMRDSAARGIYRESPLYLIFGHSPIEGLEPRARWQLDRLVRTLEEPPDNRVLAYVAAHTHKREMRTAKVGATGRLPELIIGSTLDPPQEVAMLRVGPNPEGRLTLRVRALSLIDVVSTCGESPACGREPRLTSEECKSILQDVPARWPCCQTLLARRNGLPCRTFQHQVTTWERLRAAFGTKSVTEDAIRKSEEKEARALLACLSSTTTGCDVGEPLQSLQDFAVTGWVQGRATLPDEGKVLACLSWAASAIQAHKGSNMSFADAIRCGFDQGTLPKPSEYLVSVGADGEQWRAPHH